MAADRIQDTRGAPLLQKPAALVQKRRSSFCFSSSPARVAACSSVSICFVKPAVPPASRFLTSLLLAQVSRYRIAPDLRLRRESVRTMGGSSEGRVNAVLDSKRRVHGSWTA